MYPATFAATRPDFPAAIMAGSGQRLTYRELDARSARLARHLRLIGLRRGDHVALLSDNDLRVFEVYWAALRSGFYLTAVNSHLAPGEVAHIVNDCEAKALIGSARLAGLLDKIVDDTPRVQQRLCFGGELAGHGDYEAALAAQPDGPLEDQPCGADMLYSSGTTGLPKGILLPLPDRQVDEPGDTVTAVFGPLFGFDENTVYLSPAPLYHAAPLRYCAMTHRTGGTVIVMERFDAEQALSLIERYRVTHSQWVPTMFVRMLKLDEQARARYDVSSLKVAVHAAAPCPVEVKRQMIDWWGPVLQEYYAATETNGITIIDSEQWLAHPGSVGQDGFLGVARICGDDGDELPTGEIGTIYFERDELPFSYHNDPAKTRSAQHPRHPSWTTIGDIGYLDEERYLYLTDRKSFTIISGGVNIYPQEIENCLTMHPAVLDVAVIGVPDDEMGESVLAVVQPVAGVRADDALTRELLDYLGERIARYKLPRRIDFVTELPRTPTGKLVKRTIKQRYAAAAAASGE